MPCTGVSRHSLPSGCNPKLQHRTSAEPSLSSTAIVGAFFVVSTAVTVVSQYHHDHILDEKRQGKFCYVLRQHEERSALARESLAALQYRVLGRSFSHQAAQARAVRTGQKCPLLPTTLKRPFALHCLVRFSYNGHARSGKSLISYPRMTPTSNHV